MINIKLTIIAGAAAALLSFIIGIFSEVTPGALFFRAVLSGLLFAGFSAGAGILVKKFLPEIFEDQEEEREESETGGHVDIVLDENDDSADMEGDESAGLSDASDSMDEGGSKTASQTAGAEESFEAVETASSDPDAAEEIEEVEELEPAGAGNSAGGNGNSDIPDIGEFENKFAAAGSDVEDLENADSGSSSLSGGSFEVLGGSHDPMEAAKAIQTILKKEQEG